MIIGVLSVSAIFVRRVFWSMDSKDELEIGPIDRASFEVLQVFWGIWVKFFQFYLFLQIILRT